MKKFIIACMALLTAAACTNDEIDHSGEVHATATELYSVGVNTAMFSAEIYGNGITERGICWAETEFPTVDNFTAVDPGTGAGAFEIQLTNLEPGTKYYTRAYAISGNEVMYSSQFDFTTNPELTVKITGTPTSTVSKISVEANALGGETDWTIAERGVCYGTTANPTISGSKVKAAAGGLGDFSVVISNLNEATTYYLRPYVTYDEGTMYGAQVEVKTKIIAEMKDFFFDQLGKKNLVYGLLYKADNKFAMHYSIDKVASNVTITYIETTGLKDAKRVTKAFTFADDFSAMNWEKVSNDGIDFSGIEVDASGVTPIATTGATLAANMTTADIKSIFLPSKYGGIGRVSELRVGGNHHGSIPADYRDKFWCVEFNGGDGGPVIGHGNYGYMRWANKLDATGTTLDITVVNDLANFVFDRITTGNDDQKAKAAADLKPITDIVYDAEGTIIFKATKNTATPTQGDFEYYMISKNKVTWIKWYLRRYGA